MKRFQSFKSLTATHGLYENISASKAFMIKKFAERKGVTSNELTDEDKAAALQNQDYRKIIELIGNAHNFAYAFTKFKFDHGATLPMLKELFDKLKADPSLLKGLPMPLDNFANSENVNGVNSFEALNDAIFKVGAKRKSRWIIDLLPGDLRRNVKAQPEEVQQKLLNIATIINDLGEEVKDRLLKKSKAFSTAEDFLAYAENYVKGYSNNDITSKMEKIEELEPEAGVLYADDKYLMLSARTEKAQKDLCSIASWCINRGSFNNSSYGGGAIQINTFNFTLPETDPMHLLGTTISYEGQVTYSHDINDRNVKFTSDPVEHFRKFGYPDQMIKVLMATLPIEAVIKRVVTNLQLDKKKPLDIFEDIVKSSYAINTENNEAATKVIMNILMERIAPLLTKDETFAKYLKLGVLSVFSAKLFNTLMENIEPAKKQQMMDANSEIFAFLKKVAAKQATVSPTLKNVLDAEEQINTILAQGINETTMAEPMVKPKPTIAPPTTRPSTPSRPSPIPTKRPAVDPAPKAEAEDVVKKFYAELNKKNIDVETLLKNK